MALERVTKSTNLREHDTKRCTKEQEKDVEKQCNYLGGARRLLRAVREATCTCTSLLLEDGASEENICRDIATV